jgi:alpha-beta hydrolase superfamily lysophospholipase
MIRSLAAGAAASLLILTPAARAAEPPPAAQPEDATVAVDSGNADGAFLYGSFLRPVNKNSYSAVLILPEAGADRNGNDADHEAKPDTYHELAKDLAAHGIASVRIDKRGVGQSIKAIDHEEDLRFSTYVDDAVTWIKFLKAQPHVGCVAVFGHSESALVAALAAQKVSVCAIIEASGASRPFASVLAGQLKTAFDAGRFNKEDFDQASRILDQLTAGHQVLDPPKKLDPLFRRSVQPYLISWLNLNPVDALKTNTPVLIIQGSSDFQLNSDDPRRLSTAPKKVRVVMVPGADHDLKIKAADAKSDQPRPLSPQVATAIDTFLDSLKWHP